MNLKSITLTMRERDDVSGNQLNSEEVVATRLDEIKQLHSHDMYDKVALAECWQSKGRAPVKVA